MYESYTYMIALQMRDVLLSSSLKRCGSPPTEQFVTSWMVLSSGSQSWSRISPGWYQGGPNPSLSVDTHSVINTRPLILWYTYKYIYINRSLNQVSSRWCLRLTVVQRSRLMRSSSSRVEVFVWECTTLMNPSLRSLIHVYDSPSPETTHATCRPRIPSWRLTMVDSKISSRLSSRKITLQSTRRRGYGTSTVLLMIWLPTWWRGMQMKLIYSSEGGFVWACKNYDGDVQADALA